MLWNAWSWSDFTRRHLEKPHQLKFSHEKFLFPVRHFLFKEWDFTILWKKLEQYVSVFQLLQILRWVFESYVPGSTCSISSHEIKWIEWWLAHVEVGYYYPCYMDLLAMHPHVTCNNTRYSRHQWPHIVHSLGHYEAEPTTDSYSVPKGKKSFLYPGMIKW